MKGGIQMKKITKRLLYVPIVIFIIVWQLFICSVIAGLAVLYIPKIQNNIVLGILMNKFTDTVSEQADIVESKGIYGKLNGNGNGINFFGAALVRKSSIKDIDSLVENLKDEFEVSEYCEQKGQDVSSVYLEHGKITFDTDIEDSSEYITIIFYNSSDPHSNLTDIAGH